MHETLIEIDRKPYKRKRLLMAVELKVVMLRLLPTRIQSDCLSQVRCMIVRPNVNNVNVLHYDNSRPATEPTCQKSDKRCHAELHAIVSTLGL